MLWEVLKLYKSESLCLPLSIAAISLLCQTLPESKSRPFARLHSVDIFRCVPLETHPWGKNRNGFCEHKARKHFCPSSWKCDTNQSIVSQVISLLQWVGLEMLTTGHHAPQWFAEWEVLMISSVCATLGCLTKKCFSKRDSDCLFWHTNHNRNVPIASFLSQFSHCLCVWL